MAATTPDGHEGFEQLLSQYRAFWQCARVRCHLDLRSWLKPLLDLAEAFKRNNSDHMVLCEAQEIQDERALPGQKVVWLLVSDNEQVRHAAAQRYPGLVLTNLKR